MRIPEVTFIAVEVATGVDKAQQPTQAVTCIELAAGMNAKGYWPLPEIFRVVIPAHPALKVAFGATVKFIDFELGEWVARDGKRGIRRAAASAEVLPASVAVPVPAVRRGES
ncbi:MAG: hypothetical protein ACYDGN_14655 [Acidimicrobiales bacterium]